MTDFGAVASVLVAVSDLKLVKSIRNAIRANLIAEGGIEGPLGNIEMPHPLPPTRNIEVNSSFGSRPLVPGVSTYRPRAVVRPEVVIERISAVPAADRIEPADCDPRPHLKKGPLAPPWEMPLVPQQACGRPVIKCPPPPPDVMSKGSLLDFFM